MRRTLSVLSFLVVLGLGHLAHATPKEAAAGKDAFLGTWSGTWAGASTGTFTLTFSKAAEGKLGGSITPTPDGGDSYTSDLRSVTLEEGKLKASFVPPDGLTVISLTMTVEGGAGKGSYIVKEKGDQGGVVETGTFTAKKK